MHTRRLLGTLTVALGLLVASGASVLGAQGVTTGGVGGLVTDTAGTPLPAAQIQITDRSTGTSVGTVTRDNGRYLVQGLQVGRSYAVSVRRIGFEPQTRENVIVSLSQTTQVNFTMGLQATQLQAVAVVATSDFSPTRKGIEKTIGEEVIRSTPTLDRDITDLVKLTPQVSSPPGAGPSAGGAYNRFNNFTIDGANQNDRFNLASSEGTPGGATGGRLISLDAVKEFQVLLSPADVRHGNFTGMLVNAVTKNGTNTFTGGATYVFRNSDLAANEPFLRNADFQVQQVGFTLGGPIIKDKLHFFIAPEFQKRSQPATGPYEGGPAEAGQVPPATLRQIETAMAQYFDIGSTGLVTRENPLTNLSARFDWSVTQNHRLVFRQLYNSATQDEFSRNASTFNATAGVQNSGFRYTSNAFEREATNQSSVLQLFSYLANGRSNEFQANYNVVRDVRRVPIAAPEISVAVVPTGGTTPNASVTFGTEQFSPGNDLQQKILEVFDNFSIPLNNHTVTLGGRYENTDIYNFFGQRSYGVYSFASVAALQAGTPGTYSLGYSNGGPIAADFSVSQYSLYAQDQWSVNDRLSVTYGLRADLPIFNENPVQNDTIAARFAARGQPVVNTSATPETRVLWSPRIGFNWNITGDERNQLRGTAGVFTGNTPLILLGNAYANTGLGLVTLNCTGATQVPAFTVDVDNLPRSCLGQPVPAPGRAGTAGININDENFKYPQVGVVSLGFDRALPADFIFTFEGIYRKTINGVLVRDRNFIGPRQVSGQNYTDRHGRVLYADTISLTGGVTNTNQKVISTLGTPAVTFGEGVIEVTNQSKDYNYSLSTQLRRRFGQSIDASVAYTFTQSKDLQSLTSDRAISNWRNGAQPAGNIDDLPLTTSVFQRPHRVIASTAYTAPWQKWETNIGLYYEGLAGAPVTYTANGDLNGDGFNGNDPLYIPRDATDPTEIQLGAPQNPSAAISATNPWVYSATQAQAFEQFISDNECLNEQRGRIMERNSCESPWRNRFDLQIRQSIPEFAGQRFSVQLDIINVGNLLNDEWGKERAPVLSPTFPQQQALQQRGRAPGALNQSLSYFTFDQRLIDQGAFVAQPTLAANFYQMQFSVRYSF
jgi:outer membrane receptor protein involved in Fe transport